MGVSIQRHALFFIFVHAHLHGVCAKIFIALSNNNISLANKNSTDSVCCPKTPQNIRPPADAHMRTGR